MLILTCYFTIKKISDSLPNNLLNNLLTINVITNKNITLEPSLIK